MEDFDEERYRTSIRLAMSVKHASSASQNIDELPPSPSDSTTLFADSRRLLKGTSTSLSYKADVFIFPTTQGVLIVASRASRPQINRNRNSKRTRLIIPELAMPKTDAEALLLEMLLLKTLSQDDYLKKGNFIPVHRDRLMDEVGGQYLAAINSLVASSAIEVNHRYSAGRFPKSYRLSQSFRSCGVKDHHLHRAKASKGSQQVLANLTGVEKRLFRSLMRIRCPSDSDSLDEWDRVRFHFIRSGRYYVSRCEYGRFHSNFTAITKAGRRLLTSADGNPLLEVDVSCCQPLLLGAHFRMNSPQAGLTVEPEYIQLCEAGQLYDHILDGLTASSQGLELDRDAVKGELIRLFFQNNDGMKTNPLGPVFMRLFPNVYEGIRIAKADNHKTLAHDLQRLESEIMIDGVCSNLLKRSPDASLVTVHDSILCEESLQHVVETEIRTQFLDICRVSPHIKLQR